MEHAPLVRESDLPPASAFEEFHPFIKGVFSQWHPTPFKLQGMVFETAEQWMMFAKARLFGDLERADQIIATPDPSLQKRLGQQIRDFDQGVWDEAKISIVYSGNREKFQQNDGASRQLKATEGKMLVEANPRDWIWGIGLAIDDPRLHFPAEWRGTNLLGRILTKVRDDLDR